MLPTLADLRQSAYQTEDRSLFFTNQQKAAATGVNVGGEVTLYSLRPAFAAPYAIDVRAARGSGMDPAIAVYDEAGDQVAVNDDASLADSSSRLVVPLLAGRHYSLAVTSYDTAVTGGYTVDVAARIGDDPHENNNTRPRATAMPLAAAVQGVMADNRDLYVVVLKGVGRLGSSASIDFDHVLGDLDLTLLDRKGREITRSEGTTDREVVSLAGLPAGRYYLDVHGYGGAYNPAYTLTTDIQVGTTRAAAIPA
ncbi:MAG: hypothetical protein EBX35_08385, partial [Planctomycetia bacterium]|nr:hypothetical protein [Planctomycetia bacterium]